MKLCPRYLLLIACGVSFAGTALARSEPPAVDTDIERRLQAVESLYQELLKRETEGRQQAEARYDQLELKYEALNRQLETEVPNPPRESIPPLPSTTAPNTHTTPLYPHPIVDRIAEAASSEREDRPPLVGFFDDGFLFQTPDEELQLRLHILDQTDFKAFVPGDQSPARSGLYIPRVRFYFEGQLTRQYEYEVSLQRSVEGVWDLLDGNLNIRPDERFQIRFGRGLVPYSYAWYDHLEQYFIVPERGLYPLNFGLSRSAGLTVHGRVLEERLQYALGGFDGRLTGVADNNNTRDAVGYLNYKPFLQTEQYPALRHLNIGASGYIGQQVRPGELLPLRTSLQSSENDEAAQSASSIFLEYNEGTYALGDRKGAAVHLAWYYRQLSLEAEWQLARSDFAFARRDENLFRTGSVPIGGYHVSLGYFITGEEVTGRTTVVPLRPFQLLSGPFAPGAIELYGRYSYLRLGQQVFSEGLANPDEWTNDAHMVDIGYNWYLNRFVKFYVEWQHAMFGSPVLINPGTDKFSRQNDMFWIRCQIYY